MYNDLIINISQNKNTFQEARIFLFNLFNKDKEKVIQLEKANINTVIPYYISFLESKDINILEALNYYNYENTNLTCPELVNITIVGLFRQLEVGIVNLNLF